jgi:hypothetical protein
MKILKNHTRWVSSGAIAGIILSAVTAAAFPPAPHHSFFGVVRDEWGNPINADKAEVVLETLQGTKLKAEIKDREPGVNYQLKVPMDSGLTSDAYIPTALQPTVPFKVKVKIGTRTYLPLEMLGDYSKMGQPGKTTRLDLTLGEDSDGDGIPDAWERALLSQLGGDKTLRDINGNDDSDGDGLTNLQEYLAGTYAFDPNDGFALKIAGLDSGRPLLDFLAVTGRSYSIQGSADLKSWTAVEFRPIGATGAEAARSVYRASEVTTLRVRLEQSAADSGLKFFKLVLQ